MKILVLICSASSYCRRLRKCGISCKILQSFFFFHSDRQTSSSKWKWIRPPELLPTTVKSPSMVRFLVYRLYIALAMQKTLLLTWQCLYFPLVSTSSSLPVGASYRCVTMILTAMKFDFLSQVTETPPKVRFTLKIAQMPLRLAPRLPKELPQVR